MIRKQITVQGRVQGVGFRYITASIASDCHVTGWVYNCYDGSVAIEVQGTTQQVNLFMERIRDGNRFARVDRMDALDLPIVDPAKETGFRIRH